MKIRMLQQTHQKRASISAKEKRAIRAVGHRIRKGSRRGAV